jgi:DNA polymerase
MAAVSEGGIHRAGRCAFVLDCGVLVVTLPSGRQLRYRNARIEDRIPGYAKAYHTTRTKPTLVYTGPRGEAMLYGGKITENIVQAICRDLLATALVRADAAGLRPVLHVHDEIVCEVPAADATHGLQSLVDIMTEPPTWATGFPIGVEGFAAPRYQKGAPTGWPTAKKRSG